MSRIEFPKKSRKDGSGLWTDKDGSRVFIGKEWHLYNEITEVKEKTKSRGCYKECRSCGTCANSRRDNFDRQVIILNDGSWKIKGATYSYDNVNREWVDCNDCEPFRWHDCQNGLMRDAHGQAEPFTPDVIEMMKRTGGKPLI